MRTPIRLTVPLLCLALGAALGAVGQHQVVNSAYAAKPAAEPVVAAKAKAPPAPRFFELRTYVANPGRLEALHARFRNHTNKLFVKHGMELVGYWTPTNGENAERTLVYILAYPSKEAREASWKAFQSDPVWKEVRTASEADGGKLTEKVTSVFMTPTDYSPMR